MSVEITFGAAVEGHRRELVAYCYRYFGCYSEAEDAVQETLLRAWQHSGDFECRSSLRTWLYSIATNICLDMKRAPQRRALPTDLSGPGRTPDSPAALTTRAEATWIGPIADANLPSSGDPAEVAARRESVRLTFVAALQWLPPQQRVVLILRDVLAWSAQECAALLETTVAAVNSALARARATVATRNSDISPPDMGHDEKLLERYVTAFEAYNVDHLVALLAHDAVFSMPPYELWLAGSEEIERWWRGPGQICRNSRTIPTRANAQPAVAVYHDTGEGRWNPFAIHVLDLDRDRITAITHFMGPEAFEQFALPTHLTEAADPG